MCIFAYCSPGPQCLSQIPASCWVRCAVCSSERSRCRRRRQEVGRILLSPFIILGPHFLISKPSLQHIHLIHRYTDYHLTSDLCIYANLHSCIEMYVYKYIYTSLKALQVVDTPTCLSHLLVSNLCDVLILVVVRTRRRLIPRSNPLLNSTCFADSAAPHSRPFKNEQLTLDLSVNCSVFGSLWFSDGSFLF